jgi:HdeA/HdeB family
MTYKTHTVAAALLLVSAAAQAQTPTSPSAATVNFEQAVYVTCREAHAMQPEARKTLALFLAEHISRYRGVVVPNDDRGTQVAYLVRGGCTLAPDAYLFTMIDRAILAEMTKLPKR